MEVEVLFSPAISIINNEFNDNLKENALILLKNNFNTFVFVSDNGDPKITKPFKTSDFRCYNFSYSNESIQWDLGKLNQFLLYEIIHNRNTCIYIKPQIKAFFLKSIKGFFSEIIESENLLTECFKCQRNFASQIPSKITSCNQCIDKGCFTDLVCHTTNLKSALNILSSRNLLSYKNLCKSNISVKSKQTDPDDYYDYVMFSFGNCSKPDKFIMEQFFNGNLKNNIKANRFFKGVRFYFLYKDIINEKDFIMDGYHSCKVKNKVSLVNLKAIVAPEYMKSTLVNSNTEKYLNKMVFLNSNYNCDEWARHAYQAAKAFIYKNPL